MLKRRTTFWMGCACLVCIMSACGGHPDKADAIRQIEIDTKCSFVQEGSTTAMPVDLKDISGTPSGSPGPKVWVFKAMAYSKSVPGITVPVVWAVPEYASKQEIAIAYWGAASEAGVIVKYLEEQQKGQK